MSDEGDGCQIVEIDGEQIRVRFDGREPLTDADRSALAEIIRAARAKLASEPPGPLQSACPTCAAGEGEFCRNEQNRVTRAHPARRALVSPSAAGLEKP